MPLALALRRPGTRSSSRPAAGGVDAEFVLIRPDVDAAALTRLVSDPALARKAAEVRAEMAAMPEPADLVPRLEKLVG